MRRKVRRLALAMAFLAIALEPFLFAGSFAGDAQVHLVFAETASHGRFFEFNPGERVSGETSPGYMLLGAVLFRTLPARLVPPALKLISLIAWYFFCWIVFRVAARALSDPSDCDESWAAVAAVVAALLPGSVYNANVGMENGLFALVVWLWINLAVRWGWLGPDGVRRVWKGIVLATMLGLSCWLRPEGLVVTAMAFAFRFYYQPRRFRQGLLEFGIAAGLGAGCLVFQYRYTGDIVATSILSRHVLAMGHAWKVGSLIIDPTFAKRLVLYAPLTGLFGLALRTGFASRVALNRYLVWLFALFFIVFTLTGAPQLARYLIFVAPVLSIGATYGGRVLWRGPTARGRIVAGVALVAMLGIVLTEPLYRRRQSSQNLLKEAMSAPADRHRRTDEILRDLGDPPKRPIVLACESVQQRYALDERIVVRSLDGRTDRSFFSFVRDQGIDYIGYIRRERIDVLLTPADSDLPSPTPWISALHLVPAGSSKSEEDLTFRRLGSGRFVVDDDSPEGQRPGL